MSYFYLAKKCDFLTKECQSTHLKYDVAPPLDGVVPPLVRGLGFKPLGMKKSLIKNVSPQMRSYAA